jgi:hypothetical protein
MGAAAITASHLNKASNICTMHQISNMHHYLQVEELREPEVAEEIGEAGELKVAKKTLLKSCMKDIYQQSRKIVDLDKCVLAV